MALLFCCLPLAPVQAMEVDELIRHIDRLWRGETSHASMSMTVKTRRYERNMSMEAWSRGKDYSLVVIREPVKDRGIATLKVEENIWNYLPKINRVTKVPSSMMSGSWMGSHFTNDDLVRESTFEEDYDSTLSYEGQRDGRMIYEMTALPKPNAPVVWGKVVMLIEQQTLAPYRALYYDEEGELVRTLTFDMLQQIGERVVPMRMSLQPEDKPDESTVIRYHDIEFGVPLETAFFSLQSLKQRR
ncbi:MAG: outer membrane lipoprotein-sorting protein [Gammaproteobacteria bacterium]|nr:outer membrane lipoprotein-sorting protein [Gammaproteobacteria bacterium]MCW8959649.1 outer membrane lipoprotein-sorting protein [Gammaproteobacteria bacterium]MCW8972467.1 outer membrane lipoprotein-sorting protein [Gammaproteobacteria bacterium]MCW8992183.1 outer membrane lipoprotein-sorting protein [Gammaproteobacteria bacterium]MCW9088880.1 outer membrane lipoprotein-sorting protein [Gammaproteobacteria bacterium]